MDNKKKYFEKVLEFDSRLESELKEEDLFSIVDSNTLLRVAPNSTDYLIGETKFKSPFYLQLTDYDLLESVSIGLSLKEAEKLVKFLQEKIDYIKENTKNEE